MVCPQVLDKDKKGYMGSEELTKFMTQEGQSRVFTIHFG